MSDGGKEVTIEHPINKPKMYSKTKHCADCGMMINMWARTRHGFKNSEGNYTTCSIRCVADMAKNAGEQPTKVQVALYLEPDRMIDADKAIYIIGSAAKGTMTMRSKIAFDNRSNAEKFVAGHGGHITDFKGALNIATKELPKSAKMIDAKRKRTGKIKEPSADTRCAVCNMFPAKYPQFNTQILTAKHGTIHFCSSQCLVEFTAHPDQYVIKKVTGKMTWVHVHPDKGYENAIGLYYVVGSRLLGPMGTEAIAFRSKNAAYEFVAKKGGQAVRYQQLTPELIKKGK
ncbi:nitrous oxide reductase accessory protein NosL [Thermodesulfobacteriota bacterium]